MRIIMAVLMVLLIALQIQVWQERARLKGLEQRLAEQTTTNVELKARNDALFAEVQDLRVGLEAIEERARAELGLVGEEESFYLIVDPSVVGELQPSDSPGSSPSDASTTETQASADVAPSRP